MIDPKSLLADLQQRVTLLEDDLRARCTAQPEVDAPLRQDYDAAREKGRTGLTYNAWRDEELTQSAVAWVLAGVFVRFLEDNELIEVPFLAGAAPGRHLRAQDEHSLFFRQHPTASERDYFEHVFTTVGRLPGMKDLFDRRHNPLWRVGPTADAAKALLEFWRRSDPDTGRIMHDFSDAEWNTRFLGDLYQDLSEAARKRFALLQTPDFVEAFILDRTLAPAINTFGYRVVRMIDPTCGSGHFCLGAFERLFRLWQAENPGENPRVLAQRALDGVYGVDLNPFAVAIARFRLLLAALRVSGIQRLANAPDFKIHLAAGDSLLHGRRFREHETHTAGPQMTFDTEEAFRDELKHHYEVENVEALHRILGQQYHAVVGNPPYITVKDRAVSELYRARFPSCHRQYSLSVPFMERFFDLAVKGDGTLQKSAGFVGQITANSFCKAEFGKRLVEQFIPEWDVTHVVDTSGAELPGHGTPTLMIFGRNQKPVASVIRSIKGIRSEPEKPDNPGEGLVWRSICALLDNPGTSSEFVSAEDSPRAQFHTHPWSIGGGGTSDLKTLIEDNAETILRTRIVPPIGRAVRVGEEEAFVFLPSHACRTRVASNQFRGYLEGEFIRDWSSRCESLVWYPYTPESHDSEMLRCLWPWKSTLLNRATFQGNMEDAGRRWFEYMQHTPSAYRTPLAIAFAFVATHNHFVLNRGGQVFKQTAPVIKLSTAGTESDHVALLGVLNSSVVCFWARDTFFPRGGFSEGKWEERMNWNGTPMEKLPIPASQPTQLPTALVKTSTALQAQSPSATLASWKNPESGDLRPWLARARDLAAFQLRQLIAWQEELDWQIYEAYGLVDPRDGVSLPEGSVGEWVTGCGGEGVIDDRPLTPSPVHSVTPPAPGLADGVTRWQGDKVTDDRPITPSPAHPVTVSPALTAVPPLQLGERAFEIVMARKMAAGELQTTWFERHSSTPITEIPAHWPPAYRELVERRIARIASDPNIRLIEQPEYKRRWNTEPWDEQLQRALRAWLLNRLECYFFGGERMEGSDKVTGCGGEGVTAPDPSLTPSPSHPVTDSLPSLRASFQAGQQPVLVSTNQLATVVETDADFLAVAEVYTGGPGFSVSKLVRELVEAESVPFLPCLRYKESGLRKRHDWEHVWDLQRKEDVVEDRVKRDLGSVPEAELQQAVRAAQKTEVGEIPVPPKYASGDFKKSNWWRLRGKLDVPKERWISYPGAEREGDPSPVIAWAGWDHAQQAQALAAYYLDASQNQGWPAEKLRPLLAGLADLLPWLKQWHNQFNPDFSSGLGDYFAAFLDEEARRQGTTVKALNACRLGQST